MMSAATEKACLPSLVLGIESCCEVDDLSCLGMKCFHCKNTTNTVYFVCDMCTQLSKLQVLSATI